MVMQLSNKYNEILEECLLLIKTTSIQAEFNPRSKVFFQIGIKVSLRISVIENKCSEYDNCDSKHNFF